MVLFDPNRRGLAGPVSLASLFLSLTRLFDTANAIPTVSVTGSKLYDTNGKQFFIKGVYYEVDSDDNVLATTDQCKIDAPLMKELGVNTIRVRNVDGSSDSKHDGCMSAFEDAGIYVLVHLHSGSTGVSPSDPQWNEYMFDNFAGIVDTFAKYDNLLGYMADNVKVSAAGPSSGPYIKAAISDMKAYRDSKGYRNFPIGYIEGYDTDISLGEYLTCGDSKQAVDFYAVNGDASCSSKSDSSDFLDNTSSDASEFNVPIFEGNVGCSDTDLIVEREKLILDTKVSTVMSGGSIFTWVDFDDASFPHLVTFPDDEIEKKPVTPTKNNPYYSKLKKAWESEPTSTAKSDYNAPTETAKCPSSDGDWAAALKRPLPTLADTLISTSAPSSTNTANPSGAAEKLKSDDDSSGISTGAKIAIGVVVPVVVIIAAVAIFFIYRRRRQQRGQEQELPAVGYDIPKKDPPAHVQGFYEKEQPDQAPPRAELDQQAGFAPNQHPVRELEGNTFVGELEDTSAAVGDGRNMSR